MHSSHARLDLFDFTVSSGNLCLFEKIAQGHRRAYSLWFLGASGDLQKVLFLPYNVLLSDGRFFDVLSADRSIGSRARLVEPCRHMCSEESISSAMPRLSDQDAPRIVSCKFVSSCLPECIGVTNGFSFRKWLAHSDNER